MAISQSDVVVGLAVSYGTAVDNDGHMTEGKERGKVDRPYGVAVGMAAGIFTSPTMAITVC